MRFKLITGLIAIVLALVGLGLAAWVGYRIYGDQPRAVPLEKNKWQLKLSSEDGWVNTGIPIIANQRITIKNKPKEGNPNLLVRIGGEVVFIPIFTGKAAFEVVEWDTQGGFSNVTSNFQDMIYIRWGNKEIAAVDDIFYLETSHIPCTNKQHETDHRIAKDWWNLETIELTEK